MRLVDGECAVHKVGEVVVARAQAGVASCDRRSANSGGIACGAAARSRAGDDRNSLIVDVTGDAFGEGRVGRAVQAALVVSGDRQVRLVDGECAVRIGNRVVTRRAGTEGLGARRERRCLSGRRSSGGRRTNRRRAQRIAVGKRAAGKRDAVGGRVGAAVASALVHRRHRDRALADAQRAVGIGNRVVTRRAGTEGLGARRKRRCLSSRRGTGGR